MPDSLDLQRIEQEQRQARERRIREEQREQEEIEERRLLTLYDELTEQG